ncbi:MAG: hypothetical protein DMG58_36515 [Acidobacteria bacterium]|nr:MAG: hypothetical protein DMG58_36515 [Acidobacteriota bacterium]
MERFLYRLAQSPFADRFILKGALLLTAWRAPVSRPTIDIDLAGRTSNELDHIAELVGSVCDTVAEPDGIGFNRASIEVSRIKEDADYEGVRVKFHAVLAKARVPMQIDMASGILLFRAQPWLSIPPCSIFRLRCSKPIPEKLSSPKSSKL